MKKEALLKSLKEILRLLLLALVSWLLADGVVEIFSALGLAETNVEVIAPILLLVLKGLDKWLHELGVEQSNKEVENWKLRGLTRF